MRDLELSNTPKQVSRYLVSEQGDNVQYFIGSLYALYVCTKTL